VKFIKAALVPLIFLLAFTLVPTVVFAHDDASETEDHAQQQASEMIKKLLQERREAAKKRLEDNNTAKTERQNSAESERFKKACENRQASYKNRLENIAERSQKHIEVLDKIVERLKNFKETKNLTVDNYDALLTNLEAKKLIVHNVQEAAKELASADFSCDRTAALEAVKAFTDILHQQISALKDYKTATKDLIVAIKTAAQAVEKDRENAN